MNLRWEKAIQNIIELENCGSKCDGPVEYTHLKEVWSFISESMCVSVDEVCQLLKIDCSAKTLLKENLTDQLLKLFQVLVVSKAGTCPCVVNLHELVLTPGAFEYLLNLDSDSVSSSSSTPPEQSKSREKQPSNASSQQLEKAASSSRRRQPIVHKFPSIVPCTIDFIKQHGFRAHQRRRTSTATSLGITIKDIKCYLYENVPGLREHSIGDTTIR